ncbi:MAG: hypothetical protein ACP5LW_03050 [Nitrososphaeria archaeon]
MSTIRVRALALAGSALSIGASFLFSIAVTRKLPLEYLGLLNVFSAAIAIGSLPIGISSFMSTRLVAKYRGIRSALVLISLVLGIIGVGISGGYLFGLRDWIPASYLSLIAIFTFLSLIASSISAVFSSGLTVFNRPRLVYGSFISSTVKMLAVVYIYVSGWTLYSVIVGTFFISLSTAVYYTVGGLYLLRERGSIRMTAKEVLSGAWVSLLGYASSNLRSLDSFFIATLGGVYYNALWQVLGVVGSAYSFRGTLVSITYGELLEVRERIRRIYLDFLMVMTAVTDVTLFIIFFEPNIMAFLRPQNLYLIGVMYVPLTMWAIMNLFNTASMYISNVMQGFERVDIEREIEARTYWKSLIFYAHFAEFLSTLFYVASIVPFMLAFRAAGDAMYVIEGAIAASWASVVLAIIIRVLRFPQLREQIRAGEVLKDLLAPALASALILLLIRIPIITYLPPVTSAYRGLAELVLIFMITTGIYYSVSLLLSGRIRLVARIVIKRILRRP